MVTLWSVAATISLISLHQECLEEQILRLNCWELINYKKSIAYPIINLCTCQKWLSYIIIYNMVILSMATSWITNSIPTNNHLMVCILWLMVILKLNNTNSFLYFFLLNLWKINITHALSSVQHQWVNWRSVADCPLHLISIFPMFHYNNSDSGVGFIT